MRTEHDMLGTRSLSDHTLYGLQNVDDSFCTSALQGGAGTSTNMNVNEVIANLALTVLGQALGNYDTIHPLDDVNRGQSFRKFRTTP